MSKSKKVIVWIAGYIISLSSLLAALPIALFLFYPYSVLALVVYVITIVLLSLFSFRKTTVQHTNIKKLLFSVLLIPIIVLLAILISIQIGSLHYPG